MSLVIVFLVSFQGGEERARLDASDQTTLPMIMFEIRSPQPSTNAKNNPTETSKDIPESYHGKTPTSTEWHIFYSWRHGEWGERRKKFTAFPLQNRGPESGLRR